MRVPGAVRRERLALAALITLLALSLAARLWALGLEGHSGDVLVMHRWAELLADVGPWGFYEHSISIYPALLYLYWPLGVALDGEALELAIKGSSIPFDLAIGVLLFVVVRGLAGPGRGLAAAALYLLNPAVLMAGPMWGQVDAAGTLPFVAALVALAVPRYALAAALAMLAGLVKPQFGLVLLPVLAMAMLDWRATGRLGAPLRVLGAGLATYLAVTLPLLLDPIRLVQHVMRIADYKPFMSASAPNPWALAFGYRVPDAGFAIFGVALLLLGLAAALLLLRHGRDLRTLLTVGLLIVFAFYFLPTRVHERYLFPALALLAPMVAASRAGLAAYVAMSAAFAASLLASLAISMPSFPAGADVLVSPAAVWAQGLTLAAAALIQIWLALRASARPPFPGRTSIGRRLTSASGGG
jgi:dolichyl-phosphate-mannose-protein mannosyltransferase